MTVFSQKIWNILNEKEKISDTDNMEKSSHSYVVYCETFLLLMILNFIICSLVKLASYFR